MRRIVVEMERGRGRAILAASILGLALADQAPAGDGDGPDLTPPTEMPIVSRPTTPSAKPTVPRPNVNAPGQRAVLAVPGILTPSARPPTPAETSTTPLEPLNGELSLEAPIEMRAVPSPAPGRTPSSNPSGRSARPLVLESSPMGDERPLEDPRSSTNPSTKQPSTIRPQPQPLPGRRSRLFGLLPAPPTSPAPSSSRTTAPARRGVEDLRDDPATESALKRRVERQAREAVGNRTNRSRFA